MNSLRDSGFDAQSAMGTIKLKKTTAPGSILLQKYHLAELNQNKIHMPLNLHFFLDFILCPKYRHKDIQGSISETEKYLKLGKCPFIQ